MWLSGYAARTHPAEGKLQDLTSRPWVLDDGQGHVALLVTLDLVGITRELSLSVRNEINRRWHIPAENVRLAVSAPHSGPAVEGNLTTMYPSTRNRSPRARRQELEANILKAVSTALDQPRAGRAELGAWARPISRSIAATTKNPMCRACARKAPCAAQPIPTCRCWLSIS